MRRCMNCYYMPALQICRSGDSTPFDEDEQFANSDLICGSYEFQCTLCFEVQLSTRLARYCHNHATQPHYMVCFGCFTAGTERTPEFEKAVSQCGVCRRYSLIDVIERRIVPQPPQIPRARQFA